MRLPSNNPTNLLFCDTGACQSGADSLSVTQVHASEELTTVIDGEALVDDGIAAVLYAMFLVSS